jgi:GR25 family glycosyltransferase involved in LPS biosynthesis
MYNTLYVQPKFIKERNEMKKHKEFLEENNDKYSNEKDNDSVVKQKIQKDELTHISNQQSKIKEKEFALDGTLSWVSQNPSPFYSTKDDKFKHINNGIITDFGDNGVNDDEVEKQNNNGHILERFDEQDWINMKKVETYDEKDDMFLPVKKRKMINVSDYMIKIDNVAIYLINMSKNQDRYKRFKKSFAKTDMSDIGFKRIEGVNGRLLDLNEYLSDESHKKIIKAEKNGYRKYHYELTRGAVGCYLSHLNCYKEIATQKEEYGIIFEDDVKILKPNLLNDINTVIELIPSDWDILLLGCVCFVCGKSSQYYDVNRYFLMHGYIVKKSSARKILHILENEPIEQQIDAKFSDLTEKGLLKIYCLRNKLAVQWDMGTNIQLPVKNIDGVNPFDAIIN